MYVRTIWSSLVTVRMVMWHRRVGHNRPPGVCRKLVDSVIPNRVLFTNVGFIPFLLGWSESKEVVPIVEDETEFLCSRHGLVHEYAVTWLTPLRCAQRPVNFPSHSVASTYWPQYVVKRISVPDQDHILGEEIFISFDYGQENFLLICHSPHDARK